MTKFRQIKLAYGKSPYAEFLSVAEIQVRVTEERKRGSRRRCRISGFMVSRARGIFVSDGNFRPEFNRSSVIRQCCAGAGKAAAILDGTAPPSGPPALQDAPKFMAAQRAHRSSLVRF